MTERLYYQDSHLFDFTARITGVKPHGENLFAVTLNRTAFYPTGGGQPHDTGTIETLNVVDCLNADESPLTDANEESPHDSSEVTHIVEARENDIAGLPQNADVTCHINRARRLDHIQQHTAQHILSRAFLNLYDAPTQGFRIMPTYAEVDIKLDNANDEHIAAALELANNIVWENRSVNLDYLTADEVKRRGVRSRFAREGTLRVVEICDFDLNPCGGTHATQTGEVGMIFIPVWERAKGLARLTFVAGRRAFDDYTSANKSARETAKLFTVARDEISEAVKRLQDEHKSLQRRTRALEELAAEAEAAKLLAAARSLPDGTRVVIRHFDSSEKDAAALRPLAHAVTKHARTVCLLAAIENDTARLVFARAKDAPGDMNLLLRDVCAQLDGRGGGTSELAQGGGKLNSDKPDLQTLLDNITARL